MIDPTKYVVITRSNYRQYKATGPGGIHPNEDLDPLLSIGSAGYQGWQAPDQPRPFRGPKPVDKIIPRSEWVARIKAGEGMKAYNAVTGGPIHSKDQNGLNYCWCYGSVRCVEIVRVLEGLPYVELSPESVGGPVKNWRNVGGFASEAFQQIQTAGICEQSFLDKRWSLNPRNWKTGWQANATLHEAVDWYNLDGDGQGTIFEQMITCLLMDKPCAIGLGWWGHLVAAIAPVVLQDGTVGVMMQNSWLDGDWPRKGDNGLAILTEDMGTPDGAAAPIITIDAPVNPPQPQPDPPPSPFPPLPPCPVVVDPVVDPIIPPNYGQLFAELMLLLIKLFGPKKASDLMEAMTPHLGTVCGGPIRDGAAAVQELALALHSKGVDVTWTAAGGLHIAVAK